MRKNLLTVFVSLSVFCLSQSVFARVCKIKALATFKNRIHIHCRVENLPIPSPWVYLASPTVKNLAEFNKNVISIATYAMDHNLYVRAGERESTGADEQWGCRREDCVVLESLEVLK
ncbi:MAG: hypothetical protein ISR65_16630 [Bacteriovoracaceae bacterium]|nr:hypothetical protein [Bacteriovoracaceae bacterium]